MNNSGISSSECWNFYNLKTGGPNFWGAPILQKVWIIWCPLLYFNFKSFKEPNSLSFIRPQCILHDSGVLFSESWNFYKLNDGINFWGEPIFQKVSIIWYPLLYFYFQSFVDRNYFSFIRCQYIVHVSGVLFAESWNVYKLKWVDLISGSTKVAESLNYLVPPSVFQFWKFYGSKSIVIH